MRAVEATLLSVVPAIDDEPMSWSSNTNIPKYESRLPPVAVSVANQLQARPATISNTAETTNNGFDAEANARPTTLEPPRPSTPKTDAAAPGNIAVIAPQPTTMAPAPTAPNGRVAMRPIPRHYFEPRKTYPTTKR